MSAGPMDGSKSPGGQNLGNTLPTLMGVAGLYDLPCQPLAQPRQVVFKQYRKQMPRYTDVIMERRLSVLLLQSANVVTGLAWRASVLAIIKNGNMNQDTENEDIAQVWMVTGIASCVFVILILAGLFYKKRCAHKVAQIEGILKQKESESTRESLGDELVFVHVEYIWFRSARRGMHTLISWGLVFSLVLQLDAAIAASLPRDPAYWKVIYFCSLLSVSMLFPTMIYYALGERGRFLDKHAEVAPELTLPIGLADCFLSGSVYAIALSFMEVTTAVFKLQRVSDSANLAYLSIITAVLLVITFATLVLVDATDLVEISMRVAFPDGVPVEGDMLKGQAGAETANTEKIVLKEAEDSSSVLVPVREVPCCPGVAVLCTHLRDVTRRYIAKLLMMCTCVALYQILYVSLACAATDHSASVMQPLPIWAGVIMLVLSLLVGVMASISCDFLLQMTMSWVLAVDMMIPGSPVTALALTVTQVILEAMTWLIGCSFNALAMSIFNKAFENASRAVTIALLIAYSSLMTLISTGINMKFPPPVAEEAAKRAPPMPMGPKDTE